MTYCFEVTNTGDTFLSDITISDPDLTIDQSDMTLAAGDDSQALAPGGTVLVADECVADHFSADGDELERMMYGWSVVHCLPACRCETPSAAIGTVIRRSTVEALAAEAGFASVVVPDVDAGFFRLYALTR